MDMGATKYVIRGSDCIGVFATATDKYVFSGIGTPEGTAGALSSALSAKFVGLSLGNSNLVGVFSRGNSKGLLLSNLTTEYELEHAKSLGLDLRIEVLRSPLNAVGNNIIANDKIAFVNPEYRQHDLKFISDVLGVEVMRYAIGNFKTVGANNILTNKGFVVNNHTTDKEKEELDKITGVDSVRTTANTGSLGIGISAAANSNGVVVGSNTTGYELARIIEGLNLV